MTNAEIIATNLMLLIADGKLEEGDEINYVKAWNKKGFYVKKDEVAITKFAIWYPKTQKELEKEREKAEEEGREFVANRFKFVTTSWFTNKQVEPIKPRHKNRKYSVPEAGTKHTIKSEEN